MESEPQPPTIKQDNTRTTVSSAANGAEVAAPKITLGGPRILRRHPVPSFWGRIFHLCLRPESWAESARYPTYVTFVPLILAILIAAIGATAGQTYRQIGDLRQFAANYDQNYPTMELNSDGILSAKGELKAPVRVSFLGAVLLVDPTGATKPERVSSPEVACLITDKSVVYFNHGMESWFGPYREHPIKAELAGDTLAAGTPSLGLIALPPKGEVKVINGQAIAAFLDAHVVWIVVASPLWAGLQALGEAGWALLMMFMMTPLIILTTASLHGEIPLAGGRHGSLILPRRAAYRMAAAFLVPLVLVAGFLRAMGHSVVDVLGLDGGLLFWFLVPLALSIWTGWMARQMYGGKKA